MKFGICFAALLMMSAAVSQAEAPAPIAITAKSFGCISKLTPVRGFFVGNLKGDLAATLKVARAGEGVYPPGSVVQLVPTEVMVKQTKGFSDVTQDWEFFDVDVTRQGSNIRARGFANTVNRFGGNCFGCHLKAAPARDLICETGHGCDPIPLTPAMIKAIQHTDPRCEGSDKVSAEDAAALKQLEALMHPRKTAQLRAPPEASGPARQ